MLSATDMRRSLPPLVCAAMLAALWLVFMAVPTEREMGIVQRIFYFHVASAWVAFLGFFLVAGASAVYLWNGARAADRLAEAAAEVGVLFCTLVLVTGPIWARPVWGVWWTWDPRRLRRRSRRSGARRWRTEGRRLDEFAVPVCGVRRGVDRAVRVPAPAGAAEQGAGGGGAGAQAFVGAVGRYECPRATPHFTRTEAGASLLNDLRGLRVARSRGRSHRAPDRPRPVGERADLGRPLPDRPRDDGVAAGARSFAEMLPRSRRASRAGAVRDRALRHGCRGDQPGNRLALTGRRSRELEERQQLGRLLARWVPHHGHFGKGSTDQHRDLHRGEQDDGLLLVDARGLWRGGRASRP